MAQDLTCLSDPELIRSLKALIRDERRHLVSVLRHLAEMDRRRLAHREGFPSLFDYCVRELRYAEGEAARRIHAARAAAKYPMVYRAIDRGLLSLTRGCRCLVVARTLPEPARICPCTPGSRPSPCS